MHVLCVNLYLFFVCLNTTSSALFFLLSTFLGGRIFFLFLHPIDHDTQCEKQRPQLIIINIVVNCKHIVFTYARNTFFFLTASMPHITYQVPVLYCYSIFFKVLLASTFAGTKTFTHNSLKFYFRIASCTINGKHRRRNVEKSCVIFLLCDPG